MNPDGAREVELAERLADRFCHDILSGSQALASGLDLLSEASTDAARNEAIQLLTDGLASQRSRMVFARRAFGPGPGATANELRDFVEGHFADLRASVEWAPSALDIGPVAARAVLNLAQIAADALAVGGVARITIRTFAGETSVVVEAIGPRVAPREETLAGLAGQAFTTGLGGRWVQGAFLHALVTRAGGALTVEPQDGTIRFAVTLPAGA